MKTLFCAAVAALVLAVSACGAPDYQPSTHAEEQRSTENNQRRLINDQPPPVLETSLERANLIERLSRINQQNMTGCIYLVSHGSVMAFYPVRGKVTSLNAYLSGQEQVLDDPNGSYDAGSVVVEMPDFDGAYGQNTDGVFFFTADTNAYVEWRGEYLWSDQCLRLNQQPLMVRQVAD